MRQSAIVLVVLAVVILIIVFFVIFYKKARIEFISKIQTIGFMKKKIRRWNGNGIKEWN